MMDDKLIETTIQEVHKSILARNRITEQEFVSNEFYILFSEEELSRTDGLKIQNISDRFTARFSQFDPITVVNSTGEVIFELAPAVISPSTWNSVNDKNLGFVYKAALEKSNPIMRHDLEVKDEMETAIVDSIDPRKFEKWIEFKRRVESQYSNVFKNNEEVVSENLEETDVIDESNKTKLTLDTSKLF